MKAMIFGAQGQLGLALQEAAPQGTQIVTRTRANCDLLEPSAAARAIAAERPNLIFNAAAYTAVDDAESNASLAFAVNAAAAGHMAAAARAAHARFVHVSTDFVFDGRSSSPYRPDDAANPLNEYGRTKREGEVRVLDTCPGALVVRTAWVHSASRQNNFVQTILRLLRERDSLRVVADQIGTPTSAASLARALWTLAETDASGILHYTDSGIASWYDFAIAIQEEALAAALLTKVARVIPIGTDDYPTLARRPRFSVLDKSATWPLLGGAAPHWRSALRQVIARLAQHA